MFGSISNMFRGQPDAGQQQQLQQAQKDGQQQVANQQTNGMPIQQPNPAAKEQEVSGLAKYDHLWQAVAKKEGEEEGFNPQKLFDLDPAKLSEGLKGFNSTQGIKQEDLAAITAGGEEAGAALLRILNASNQATLQAAITATGGMTSSAFERAMPSLDGKINSQVRTQQINSQLKSGSPLMQSEAARPMLTALAQQFSAKHQDASPEEIIAMVDDYMVTMSESMGMVKPGSAGAGSQGNQGKAKDTDWASWFDVNKG